MILILVTTHGNDYTIQAEGYELLSCYNLFDLQKSLFFFWSESKGKCNIVVNEKIISKDFEKMMKNLSYKYKVVPQSIFDTLLQII
jgi:hypothetical protein